MGLFAALSAPAYSNEVAVLDWRGALLSYDAAHRSLQPLALYPANAIFIGAAITAQ